MLYRVQLQLFLLILLAAGVILAQSPTDQKPVSKIDVFIALEAAKEQSQDMILKTNKDLIDAIDKRGVDFILTPEEEWQLEMRDASDELLAAIRDAVDPQEREARLNADRQQRLYTQFTSNYNAADLTGRSAALTAAREFVSLYASDPNVVEIVTYMQRNLPRLEQSVNMLAQREQEIERARSQALERQQQMQQQREERERRRQEAAANRSNPNAPNTTANRPAVREAPEPRQPSDPVVRQPSDQRVRTPRIPVVRRP